MGRERVRAARLARHGRAFRGAGCGDLQTAFLDNWIAVTRVALTGDAAELRRAFEEDVRGAEEWSVERWNARSWKHRLADWASALVKRQL